MTTDRLIDPTAGIVLPKIAMAPRTMKLHRKVVGLICNRKEQADLILHTIGDALRERYGVARVVFRSKETHTKPATDDLINEMAKEVQVAVAALGG